mgnify:CR=1 FL=1
MASRGPCCPLLNDLALDPVVVGEVESMGLREVEDKGSFSLSVYIDDIGSFIAIAPLYFGVVIVTLHMY